MVVMNYSQVTPYISQMIWLQNSIGFPALYNILWLNYYSFFPILIKRKAWLLKPNDFLTVITFLPNSLVIDGGFITRHRKYNICLTIRKRNCSAIWIHWAKLNDFMKKQMAMIFWAKRCMVIIWPWLTFISSEWNCCVHLVWKAVSQCLIIVWLSSRPKCHHHWKYAVRK